MLPPAMADQEPSRELSSLEIAGSWIQALTDGSKEVVALLDQDGAVQYLSVSGSVHHMVGYDALDIMSMTPAQLLHPLDVRRVFDAFGAVAAHPGGRITICLLYTSPSPRDGLLSRMPSSA